ncbi:hypothetical protein [Thalassolituus hydrocarboniclasticus]|uniref:Uncharacterized protein n=1 Tax=Thalassolituus hydrocarboniclasticus TaxID=2742796 RepID=A0ABY6AG38_9GAMM|nr:hypothetical protein [Thalassolituus hydrocarboniclasticus]UXD88763.1 hypothetical protein HUF19_15560 [Thalassolituus hydrocarboniclasticus]
MNDDIRKEIRGCIKICDNPFVRSDPSSTDLTLSAVDALCEKYAVDDILAILQAEFERLEIVIKGRVGSGTAYEFMLLNQDAHYNCKAAIAHLRQRQAADL